jgi:hypothetical protein
MSYVIPQASWDATFEKDQNQIHKKTSTVDLQPILLKSGHVSICINFTQIKK